MILEMTEAEIKDMDLTILKHMKSRCDLTWTDKSKTFFRYDFDSGFYVWCKRLKKPDHDISEADITIWDKDYNELYRYIYKGKDGPFLYKMEGLLRNKLRIKKLNRVLNLEKTIELK